jgi:hypothetical protein
MLLSNHVVIASLLVIAPYSCLCFFSGYTRVDSKFSTRLQLLNRNSVAKSNDGTIRTSDISSSGTIEKQNIVIAGDSRLPATYILGLFQFYLYGHMFIYLSLYIDVYM